METVLITVQMTIQKIINNYVFIIHLLLSHMMCEIVITIRMLLLN